MALDDVPRQHDGLGPLEEWFVERGVPQFARRYSARSRKLFLALPLAGLVAFEVGAAPWIHPTAVLLIVVPPVIIGFALWARPAIAALLGFDSSLSRSWWHWASWLCALGPVGYLLYRSNLPWIWSNAWINFAVILVALSSSALLCSRDVWCGRDSRWARRTVVLLVFATVVLFSWQRMPIMIDESLTHVPPLVDVPRSFPMLVLLLVVLVFSVLAFRDGKQSEDTTSPQFLMSACFPAASFLLVLAALEGTLLPSVVTEAAQIEIMIIAVIGTLLWSALRAARERRRPVTRSQHDVRNTWSQLERAVGRPGLLLMLLVLYLAPYPCILAGFGRSLDLFGLPLEGPLAAAVAAMINVAYLFGVYFFVHFGLDRVTTWVAKEAWSNRRTIASGLAGGLPLYLVFAAFFVLTPETWQVFAVASAPAFIGMLALLLGLATLTLALLAGKELDAQSTFRTLAELRNAALHTTPNTGVDGTVCIFGSALDSIPADRDDYSVHLGGARRANALVVVAVYQVLVLGPVTAVAAGLFWTIGRLTVTKNIALDWIYGVGGTNHDEANLSHMTFWAGPWIRVPLVLAVFSLLYLAVTLLTSQEHREYFFSGGSAALRQRIALRYAYCERAGLAPDGKCMS